MTVTPEVFADEQVHAAWRAVGFEPYAASVEGGKVHIDPDHRDEYGQEGFLGYEEYFAPRAVDLSRFWPLAAVPEGLEAWVDPHMLAVQGRVLPSNEFSARVLAEALHWSDTRMCLVEKGRSVQFAANLAIDGMHACTVDAGPMVNDEAIDMTTGERDGFDEVIEPLRMAARWATFWGGSIVVASGEGRWTMSPGKGPGEVSVAHDRIERIALTAAHVFVPRLVGIAARGPGR